MHPWIIYTNILFRICYVVLTGCTLSNLGYISNFQLSSSASKTVNKYEEKSSILSQKVDGHSIIKMIVFFEHTCMLGIYNFDARRMHAKNNVDVASLITCQAANFWRDSIWCYMTECLASQLNRWAFAGLLLLYLYPFCSHTVLLWRYVSIYSI